MVENKNSFKICWILSSLLSNRFIVSNNSSGMVCGVKHNTFHTMKSIRFILANGHTYDTSNKNDYERFIKDEESLSNGLLAGKTEIETNKLIVTATEIATAISLKS